MTDATAKKRLMSTFGYSGPLFTGALVLLLSLYTGTYAILSLQGRYEAVVWGLDHVKARRWVPKGFENNGDWNVAVVYAFLPLYHLDRTYWHTSVEAESGQYPVNSDDYYMYGD